MKGEKFRFCRVAGLFLMHSSMTARALFLFRKTLTKNKTTAKVVCFIWWRRRVVALGLPVLRDICASMHVVAPLRGFEPGCKNKKTSRRRSFHFYGGGGGSRTRVRKSSAIGSTCLADSLNLTGCYPNGREDRQRFRKKFNKSTPNKLHCDLVRVDAWV